MTTGRSGEWRGEPRLPREAAEPGPSAENARMRRSQVRELVERFELRDPELLAIVLRVSTQEAEALLGCTGCGTKRRAMEGGA